VPMISEDRFREVFNVVEKYLEDRYELPVVITDVPHPFTGDLDGAEIRVDYDLSAEESVFILAHLFGHTVQWNLSAADREIGRKVETNLPESRLAEIERYERAACGYSLQLLHEVGVLDLDQWFSDFATCDLRYLMHFYRTGVKEEFRSFWCDHAPLIEPLRIPAFQPTRWVSRADGIVV
jgi:hypothetical protein